MPAARRTPRPLTVAVTGPTGTFGFGLMPLLEAEDRIGGSSASPGVRSTPTSTGGRSSPTSQGDVRAARRARRGVRGRRRRRAPGVHDHRECVGGDDPRDQRRGDAQRLPGGRADAERSGSSTPPSVAAYGFHRDNPVGIREDWPVRPADRLFYAQEKAELEHLLQHEADSDGRADALPASPADRARSATRSAARARCPAPLAGLGRAALDLLGRLPIPVPVARTRHRTPVHPRGRRRPGAAPLRARRRTRRARTTSPGTVCSAVPTSCASSA